MQLGAVTEHGKCIVAIAGHTYVLIQVAQIVQVLQVSAAILVHLGNHLTPLVQGSILVQLAAILNATVITQHLRGIFQVVVDRADTALSAATEKQVGA